LKLPFTVPSTTWLQLIGPAARTGGSGLIVQVVGIPALSNPEPKTLTVLLSDPEFGERTICGSTMKLGVTVSPAGAGYAFVFTLTVYPPPRNTDVAPTLNLAFSCP